MHRLIFKLLAAATLAASCCSAAVYYIDRNNGSDDSGGLSPDSAWRSLARIASQPLNPGDYVLLARGGVWTEPFNVTASGAPDIPITIGAYGTGPRPIVDGSRPSGKAVDLVYLSNVTDVVFTGIEVRNSTRNGVNIFRSARVQIRDVKVWGSQQAGLITYDSNAVAIQDAEVTGNALDTSAMYDGIRIDGSGGSALTGFTIRDNVIHDNIGGNGWNSSNGIFLGHTGSNIPTLHSITISGNTIFANGNPNQNQAGRGISGTLQGDVTVVGNFVYRNASAGVYLGDYGLNLDINLTNNIFYDNALRQFGGTTQTWAYAARNLIIVDDPTITAMGAEIGGAGVWQISNNTFDYETTSSDSYRAFIRLNDATQQQNFNADWNLYFSAGPNRWKLADGTVVNFNGWQSTGFDPNGVNPN